MRSKTNLLLKDEEKLVRLEERASILQKLDELIETYEKRLLERTVQAQSRRSPVAGQNQTAENSRLPRC